MVNSRLGCTLAEKLPLVRAIVVLSWFMSAVLQLPPSAILKIPAVVAAMPLLECHILTVDVQHLLITLLFGAPGAENAVNDSMQSLVWHIGSGGQSEIWKPGANYPGSSIWFAEAGTGILLGNDFHKPEIIYACKCDGTHIASFTLPLLWDNPIRPWRFKATPRGIEYLDAADKLQSIADIATLISRVHGTTAVTHLAADWHPRPLLLPANEPGPGDILFRLTRHASLLRLDSLQSKREFQ